MLYPNCDISPVYSSPEAVFTETPFSFCFCNEVKDCRVLHPEEYALLMGQNIKRRMELCTGRYCAHVALEKIGYSDFPLLRDECGAPIWPEGTTGSISHSGDMTAAVVTFSKTIQGIGFDIQDKRIPFPSRILSILFHRDETASFLAVPPQISDLYAYAVFSAKESAIKCFYTVLGEVVDLNNIVLEMNLWNGEFAAVISNDRNCKLSTSAHKLTGRIGFNKDYVFSVSWYFNSAFRQILHNS